MGALGSSPTEVDLLIQNGAIVTMDAAGTIVYDGALAVEKGTIVAVGPADQIADQYAARETLDARHKAVLPGLIDTHHHFLQNFAKGSRDDLTFPDEWIAHVSSPLIAMAVSDYWEGNPELQEHATRLGCTEALLSGITCIVNMEWATAPQIIGVYEESGIRAVHVLTITDRDQWDRPGMLLSADSALGLAQQLIARCQNSKDNRVTFRYGPACENSVSADLLREIGKLAEHNDVGIHIHIAESRFGWENMHKLYGLTSVQYLHDLGVLGPNVLGAHCIWLTDDDIKILKETGTSVSYNPECHMKLALGIAPVAQMLEAGVVLSLGTDTCAVNDNMDMFEAMRVGAFLQKTATMDPTVVPAYRALEMATIGGARALGMEDEIGSLEVGKKADLIIVDLDRVHMRPINNLVNNLVYCASGPHDVETVIVDGQVVVENRTFLSWDARRVVDEAESYVHMRYQQAGLTVSPFYR